MLQELENKIRKAIPELMELGVGCVVKNKYKTKVKIIKTEPDYFITQDIESLNIILLHKNKEREIIGKPIQLNNVLEYVKYIYLNKMDYYSQRFAILEKWNLKSNLLSEQSIELITFINELKND